MLTGLGLNDKVYRVLKLFDLAESLLQLHLKVVALKHNRLNVQFLLELDVALNSFLLALNVIEFLELFREKGLGTTARLFENSLHDLHCFVIKLLAHVRQVDVSIHLLIHLG